MTKQTDTRAGEHDTRKVQGARQGPNRSPERDPAQRENLGKQEHDDRKERKPYNR